MKKAHLLAVVFLLSGSGRVCAGPIEELIYNHESSAANFFGTSARSGAMGQTGIAMAIDGSGIIYNPACLARIRRLEILGGLSQERVKNTTDSQADEGYTALTHVGGRDVKKIHLNALSLAVPVPTYRGALVLGFGVNRLKSFDRIFNSQLSEVTSGNLRTDNAFTERQSGGIYAWSGAAAVEVSPRMAIGGAVHVYTGTDKFASEHILGVRDTFLFTNEGTDVGVFGTLTQNTNRDISADYVGISGTVGFTYQASPSFTLGTTIETPAYWNVKEDTQVDTVETFRGAASNTYDYDWDDYPSPESSEYNIRHPFSFGLGGGFSHRDLNIALDLKYTDWSQMEYTGKLLSPFLRSLNVGIQEHYREVVAIRAGAEYVFPGPGISLRAGYFTDPLPFPSGYIKKDRKYATFGIGFLIDQVMTIDIAAVLGGYTINYKDPLRYTEEYKTRRVFLTMAYRI